MNVTIIYIDNLELVIGQQATEELNTEELLVYLEEMLNNEEFLGNPRQYLRDRGL